MTVSIILLSLLLASALWLGWASRRGRGDDFFLAGRRAGAPTVAASLTATCLGASATVGIVGRAYSLGWSAFWWLGSGALGLTLLGWLFVGPMRRNARTRTLPAWVGDCYGRPARVLAAVLIVVMWTGVIAAQWAAGATLLQGMFGLPGWAGVGLAAAVVAAYTAMGGQLSVLRTDVLQGGLIALAVLLPHVFLRTSGEASVTLETASSLLPPQGIGWFDWTALVVVVGGMYAVGPDLCSRVLTAADDRQARRGAWMAAPVLLVASVAVVSLGIRIRAAGIDVDSPQQALSAFLSDPKRVPPVFSALVQVGLLGALFSSADTCLHTASSVAVLDTGLVSDSTPVPVRARLARGLVVLLALVSALVAWLHPGIIPNMLLAYGFYAGGLLAPLFLLAMPSRAGVVSRPVVWCAMMIGGLVPVALIVSGRIGGYAQAGFVGFLVSAVILGLGAAARAGLGEVSEPK